MLQGLIASRGGAKAVAREEREGGKRGRVDKARGTTRSKGRREEEERSRYEGTMSVRGCEGREGEQETSGFLCKKEGDEVVQGKEG